MRYVMRIAEFSESSSFWTQLALWDMPESMPFWVSVLTSSRIICFFFKWIVRILSVCVFHRKRTLAWNSVKILFLWFSFTCLAGTCFVCSLVNKRKRKKGADNFCVSIHCKHISNASFWILSKDERITWIELRFVCIAFVCVLWLQLQLQCKPEGIAKLQLKTQFQHLPFSSTNQTSNKARVPAELKHINKRRKRN